MAYPARVRLGQYLASFGQAEADVPSLCGALGRQCRPDWSGACIGTGSCAGGGLHGQLGSPGSSQQLPQPTEVSTKRVASFEPLRKSARISSQLSLRCENLTEFLTHFCGAHASQFGTRKSTLTSHQLSRFQCFSLLISQI